MTLQDVEGKQVFVMLLPRHEATGLVLKEKGVSHSDMWIKDDNPAAPNGQTSETRTVFVNINKSGC